MARVASKRALHKRTQFSPVGERRSTQSWNGPIKHRYTIGPYDVSACHGCGYHLCSCVPGCQLCELVPCQCGKLAAEGTKQIAGFPLLGRSAEDIAKLREWAYKTWGVQ